MAASRLAGLLAPALLAATLANGLCPYLRRIGVSEPRAYEAYWAVHCASAGGTTPGPFGVGFRCAAPSVAPRSPEQYWRERAYVRYVYEVTTPELALKLTKDLLALAVIGAGLVAARQDGAPGRMLVAAGWPAAALLGLVGGAALVALVRHGAWLAAAGLRSFTFLPIAFTGALFARPDGFGRIAGALRALLFVQLALCAAELLYGMPMYGHLPYSQLPMRLAGTLVLPNSLGVVAVAVLAFILAFGGTRPWLTLAATALLVGAAGSATGFVTLFIVGGAALVERAKARRRLVVVAALVLVASLLVDLLPTIVTRRNLFESLWSEQGRLTRLSAAFSGGWRHILLGAGLGVGTNTSVNLSSHGPEARPTTGSTASDSTVTLLMHETGLVGVFLFYGVLARAWWRDRPARVFHLAVSVASVTLNVTELFPVNLLLGLSLAHSFAPREVVREDRATR